MEAVRRNFLYDDVLPRVEQIGWPLAIIGLALKYFLLPMGSVLFMVSANTLAVVYFLQAFSPNPTALVTAPVEKVGNSFEAVGADEPPAFLGQVAAKVVGIGAAITLTGTLFKSLFWTGANNLLLSGTGSLGLALVLLANVGQFSRKGFAIAVLGFSMLLTPTEALVRVFYRDDPALVEKMLFQEHHPRDKAARAEVLRLLHLRHER